MTTTFTISTAALFKAGSGRSVDFEDDTKSTIAGEYIVDRWINEAESTINSIIREDFVAKYATLTDEAKFILRGITDNLVAINIVAYDMGGYIQILEAEDKINVLRDAALRGLSLIRDKKVTTFIKNDT